MKGVIAVLIGLALSVNAQFSMEVGKPGLYLQMFGKDLIRAGDKKNRHRKKKSKGNQRKRKNAKKAQPKHQVTIPSPNKGGELHKAINDKPKEVNEEKIQETPEKDQKILMNMEFIPLPEIEPLIDENEVEQVEEEKLHIESEEEQEEEEEEVEKIEERIQMIEEKILKMEEEIEKVSEKKEEEKLIQVVTEEPEQIKTESEEERIQRLEAEEERRLAEMIRYMPEAEKKHLRAMATNKIQQ